MYVSPHDLINKGLIQRKNSETIYSQKTRQLWS